jgi:hypothetical protein
MTAITSILQSIRDAASYNKHELAAPRLILWPDEERLWIRVIELLGRDIRHCGHSET